MITIVGDPHAKPDNLDKINTLFDIVEDLGNPVIWLGDMLDTKEIIRGKALNMYLRRFSSSKLNHTVLVGNHDRFHVQSDDHALEALKALRNVTVVDEPYQHGEILCFPYTHDKEQLKSWIREYGENYLVLCCHPDVISFDYGNGRISEEGLELADFGVFKRVFAGHYHKFSSVDNFIYLGTPFSHSFGESNQQKYIGVYDTITDKLDLIETPFPRHMTYEVDCSEAVMGIYNQDDINRIILTGTQEQIDKFHKIEGVKYIERPTTAMAESTVSEMDSPEVQFQKWATEIKGYSKDVLDLGLEVLADA